MTSSPANRTALRLEENRPAPPSQQVIASAASGPTPYSRSASTRAPVRRRAACPQLLAQRVHPGLDGGEHVQRGGHLQLPGRGQVRGRGRPQRGQAAFGAQRALAQPRRALVEEHRVDALDPGGVLAAQVVVGLQQRPALQDLRRRDPALRQPGRRPAAAAGAGSRSCRSWRAACGRGRRRCRPARRRAPRRRPRPAPPRHTATRYTPPARTQRRPGRRTARSQARRCARSAGAIWPRRTSPVTVSR